MIEIIMEFLRKVNRTSLSFLVMHLKNFQSEYHRDTCLSMRYNIMEDKNVQIERNLAHRLYAVHIHLCSVTCLGKPQIMVSKDERGKRKWLLMNDNSSGFRQ